MKRITLLVAILATAGVLTGSAAANPVLVRATGQVEFNQINLPPLGDVSPGDPVIMTFVVDSDVFTDSSSFPTRGYDIEQASFSLTLGSAAMELQDPFPAGQTPFFVLRNNDPAVDGFFVSQNNVDSPFPGLPINQTGIFDQFRASYLVTYVGDTLDSLDILDALGTYDFTGLTIFNLSIDDGPFTALGIVFEQMTLEAVVLDEDGDGIIDSEDLCPQTVIPESIPTVGLGVNHWALVDGDGAFDTNPPPGNGPGFEFDIEDTGGCSCEQIVERLGLGQGHRRFGCSNSAMLDWVQFVAGVDYCVVEQTDQDAAISEDRLRR